MRVRAFATLAAVATLAAITAATAAADHDTPAGFHTAVPELLQGAPGWKSDALISVGDQVGGYTFDAIPDGISISGVNGKGSFDVLVNHELSLVPFPATRQDPSNAIVSRLRLSQHGGGVLNGDRAIPSSAGYQRFCSNFIAGTEHGFDRPLFFTNEEARDIVLRQEDSWHGPNNPPTPLPGFGVQLTEPGAEQAGVVVAYDPQSGQFRSIFGMGRHNHENAVAVPGYGQPVVLSGDDTFDAPASQLYMYVAANRDAVWNDTGKLYVFVATSPADVNDYGDVTAGMTVTGSWVEVPKEIATGKKDGKEVTSATFGYPKPTDPDNIAKPRTANMPDGPQWVLEYWSNNVAHAFQFIRVEDLAYDRSNGKTVYFADTGEPRAKTGGPDDRLKRDATGGGPYMNGRLFQLQLNASVPTGAATLSILPNANFDLGGYNNPNVPHQPDNVETVPSAIFFQEDPGGHNAQSAAFPNATNARVWRYDLVTKAAPVVVAEVDQTVNPTTQPKGTWESSGIVDVSSIFGPGSFLLDVQAHSWDIPAGTSNDGIAMQRERGQLLLLRRSS
jgi:Bacterial protein of unknown function (DUF839)